MRLVIISMQKNNADIDIKCFSALILSFLFTTLHIIALANNAARMHLIINNSMLVILFHTVS